MERDRRETMSSKWSSCVRGPVLISMPPPTLLLLLFLVASAGAQQTAPTTVTDPTEVNALKAVYTKLNRAAWYVSDNPCSDSIANQPNLDDPKINQGITCDCSYLNNTVCHITKLC